MALEFINTFELETTNHCNAKCIFCPRDAITRPKGYLSRDTFKIIMERAIELKIKNFVFAGFGEPFLHKDIIEFLSSINQTLPSANIDIFTNTSLVVPKISDALAKLNIREIVVSFNGYDKASYEKMMVNLSFEKVMDNLKYITDHFHALAEKIHFIPTFTKLFQEEEYNKMRVMLKNLGYQDGNFIGVYPCINRAGYLNDPELVDSRSNLKPGDLPFPSDEMMCTRHVNYLQIAWNGEIKLCYNDINNEALLGDIRTSSNEEIEQKIRYFRNPKTKPLICQRCNDPLLRGGYKHIK